MAAGVDVGTGTLADQTVAAQTLTGKAYSTVYYTFLDVDPLTLLPATYGATTVFGDSLNSTADEMNNQAEAVQQACANAGTHA